MTVSTYTYDLSKVRVTVDGIDITDAMTANDAAFSFPPRHRGPRCRWCHADDYRRHDGRCPRCGDHKDRGRTVWTMGPWWWRESYDASPRYHRSAAVFYAMGYDGTASLR